MRRAIIILLSILLTFSVSAQKKKKYIEIERPPDQIDMFLHRLDSTRSINITAMNRVINYGYQRFLAHGEWMLNKSNTREEMAYWEWFVAYVQIVSRKDMESGFVHAVKALSLTRDSGEFRCKILELEVNYFDFSKEYKHEIETLDEIIMLTEKYSGKPSFWACIKEAKLLQYLQQTDAAFVYFSKAITTGSNDSIALADAYYNRAIINLKNSNDSAWVMSDLEAAIALDSNSIDCLYKHAMLCNEWYDSIPEYHAKMEKGCERILLIDTIPTLSSIRHCALAMLGKRNEAERWIDRVMANFGDNQHNWVYIYYNKACIYAILNDVDEAIRYLVEAEMNGGVSCKKLKDDANFYNLRGTDEFEELILRICME